MFIEYSRLPGFERINVSFSRGMLRLAKFTNSSTYEERLEYFKLLAGPNKHIHRIGANDFRKHPEEVIYIYIMLISILQMEECMSILVQCPTVYWVRFDWPGKEAVNTLQFSNQTLTSAFHAIFTPYLAIMKDTIAKIKDNMLLFAEPHAKLNNLFIKHFHDLIYENIKDGTASETVQYLRTNVNIPNIFHDNKKAVFHGDRVKVGNFIGQFLSFSFRRSVKWSKLDSIDSFEATAVNYIVSVNWEKTPRKVFLPLSSDTKNLRYISRTALNKKRGNLISGKSNKTPCNDENIRKAESFSIEFPITTSAKTEYLLKSDFSLRKIERSNGSVLQELNLNGTPLLQGHILSGERTTTRKDDPSDGIIPTNACHGLLILPKQEATKSIDSCSIEQLYSNVPGGDEGTLNDVDYQSIIDNGMATHDIAKTISRRAANWISSNPVPDPYGEVSTYFSILGPNLKDFSQSVPSSCIKFTSLNPTFDPEQSARSLIIRSKSRCVQQNNSFSKNCERLKNALTNGVIKIKSCCNNLEVDKDRKENLLQKRLLFQNRTREKFKQFRNDLHRVAEALRAAKQNWDQHSSKEPIH